MGQESSRLTPTFGGRSKALLSASPLVPGESGALREKLAGTQWPLGGMVRKRQWTQLDKGRAVAAARAWVVERPAPIAATVAMFIPVMAYSVLGHRLHGHFELITPGDLWGLGGSSWALAHGQFAHIYASPGARHRLRLSSSCWPPSCSSPRWLASPPTFPAVTRLASGCCWARRSPDGVAHAVPIDAVARSWSLTDGSRLALALASALGVANVAGIWGHPEDCVAVAMVVWAALAVERRPDTGGRPAAWLLGLGVAFQPLAILGVAPVLACLGWRSFMKVSWRLLLPSLLVLVTPLIGQPGLTRFVLVKQPFLPHYVSFTPLTYLAPVIGPGTDGGGPTRLVALLLSACLAIAVCRRRHDLPTVLTMTAIAFFLRVLFETELNWYYMWPVAAVCLVLSARRGDSHLGVCSAALVATIVLGNHDAVHNIAVWWPGLMASLAVMLGSTAGRVGLHQAHGSAHACTHATEIIAGAPVYTHTASLETNCRETARSIGRQRIPATTPDTGHNKYPRCVRG